MRKTVFILVGILVFVSFAEVSNAGLINYDRKSKRAGKAVATPAAPAAGASKAQEDEPVVPFWLQTPPKVTTKDEEKYDLNKDKILQTAEVKIFLRDTVAAVDAKGGATVNSGVLKQYDKNRDNIINKYESGDIKKDLQY